MVYSVCIHIGKRWACERLDSWREKRHTKSRIFSWSEWMINHIGTETRPKLPWETAVRNIGQWTTVWSSYLAWVMKVILIVKLFQQVPCTRMQRYWHDLKKKLRPISVPAAAVRQKEQVLFGMNGRKSRAGCSSSSCVKSQRMPLVWRLRQLNSSIHEDKRISCGGVKCLDIWRNV